MNRSLKFFLEITNKYKKNRDATTGLPQVSSTNQVNVINQNTTNNTSNNYTVSTQTTNVKSLFNDRFFVNYLGNSSANQYNPSIAIPEESDISLTSIIEWTTKNHPSMILKAEDFVYLKAFRSYPANRLIVLRRYPSAIGHDIFSNSMKPLSTLVSYIPEGEMPVKIQFNEKWKPVGEDHTFMSVLQDVIGVDFSSIPGVGNLISAGESPFAQDMINKIGQNLGFITDGGMPYGDPNIIYEASVRDVSGRGINSGLHSDVTINFETTYLFQEINGVDAKAAMLDIIGNVLVMGTSPERFYVTGNATAELQKIMNDFKNGNIGGMFEKIKEGVSLVITDAIKTINNIIDDVKNDNDGILSGALDKIDKAVSGFAKNRYSRYKWQLMGLLGTMSGLDTAPWHVTIGNPKAPWFTCGNLVVDSVELIPNDVLGYNDYFTELTVKIQLKQGRSMGLTGISNLFNNGRGRIYIPDTQLKKIITESNNVEDARTFNTNPTVNTNETTVYTDGSEINTVPNISGFGLDENYEDENLPIV